MLVDAIPDSRIVYQSSAPVDKRKDFVLYWMTSARRLQSNFALDHALHKAQSLKAPLIILETLACDMPWACMRFHRFVLDGMREHAQKLATSPMGYLPFVESQPQEMQQLLAQLGQHAMLVVADYMPTTPLAQTQKNAESLFSCAFERVDGNGIFPLKLAPKLFTTAYAYRRFLQKNLMPHLIVRPQDDPTLAAASDLPKAILPQAISARWPSLQNVPAIQSLQALPIDHSVAPCDLQGGSHAAMQRMRVFVEHKLDRYEDRNNLDAEIASGLSPYLHFGHISAHQILATILDRHHWDPSMLSYQANGSRAGFWGLSTAVEGFLDQLITWRELGYVFCHFEPNFRDFDTLPSWARETLALHTQDPRAHIYPLQKLESASTHDALWNAAQNQLVSDGVIHNYLRMLWGKKILKWSESPRQALQTMIHLNDKYALDGSNPNSYSGIFWCLGRFDRAWGPERPIFGKVRYMTSQNTAKKLRVTQYLKRYSPQKSLW